MKTQSKILQSHRAALRILYVLSDFITACIAFFIFDNLRYRLLNLEIEYNGIYNFLFSSKLICEQFLFPLFILFVYWLSGFYNSGNLIEKSRVQDFINTFLTSIVNTIAIILILMLDDGVQIHSINYILICALFILLLIPTYLSRLTITAFNVRYHKKNPIIRNTLIIGADESALQLYDKLHKRERLCVNNIIGFVYLPGTDDNKKQEYLRNKPVWELHGIIDICNKYDIQQVIVSNNAFSDVLLSYLLENLFPLDISVKIEPSIQSYSVSNIKINDILGVPFIDLTHSSLSSCESNIKRLADVVISIVAIVSLLPLYIILSILIKTTSKGGIFYKQERIGRKKTKFNIYKFRSMRVDAEINGPQLSCDNDSRITYIGQFMRKYRLDELPQFWNVLKGEMSLVGPRPERKFYIDQIVKIAPYYNLIFQIRPGITSWGMVNFGYAKNVDEMVARTKYDLLYINNMSIKLDLKILIYTFRTIFRGEGL